jgi:hypothetical protein
MLDAAPAATNDIVNYRLRKQGQKIVRKEGLL